MEALEVLVESEAGEVVNLSRSQKQWIFLEQDMARQKMDQVRDLASEANLATKELMEMWKRREEAEFAKTPDLKVSIHANCSRKL